MKKGLLEFPNNEVRGGHSSPITALGSHSTAINEAITATLPESNPLQAKLKDSLKALVKLKPQGRLREHLMGLTEGEAYQLRVALTHLCPREPQGRYGWKLKLFMIIRYLQEAGGIEKPQNWMNRIASIEHKGGIWTGASSGQDGKSPSRGRSEDDLTFGSGRR